MRILGNRDVFSQKEKMKDSLSIFCSLIFGNEESIRFSESGVNLYDCGLVKHVISMSAICEYIEDIEKTQTVRKWYQSLQKDDHNWAWEEVIQNNEIVIAHSEMSRNEIEKAMTENPEFSDSISEYLLETESE